MSIRTVLACSSLVFAAALAGGAPSAHALTMKECSAKYKAAQTAGTLKGMKWNDFRKAECGTDASAAPAATPAAAPAPSTPAPTATAPAAAPAKQAKTTPAPKPAAVPAAAGDAVFPSAVSSKYSSESAGKARMHTCLDQYNANKANNANGGLDSIPQSRGFPRQA